MVIKSNSLIKDIYVPSVLVRENIKKGAVVLDIGCATGTFLHYCDEFGLKTYGTDISQEWLDVASKVTKAKLKKHNLDEGLKVYDDKSFDLITMFDVIEHMQSPLSLLEECFRVLKKNGKIVITTPNIDSAGRILIGKKWHGYSDLTHKYLFTRESLAFTAEKAGFKILRMEAPFHPLPKVLQLFVNNLGFGGQIWLVAQK